MIQNIAVNLKPIRANIFSLRNSSEITISSRLLTSTVINTDDKLKRIIAYTLFLLFLEIRQQFLQSLNVLCSLVFSLAHVEHASQGSRYTDDSAETLVIL